jgi:hypothetical protein
MTLQSQIEAHETQRPSMPRPFVATAPEAVTFHAELQAWVDKKSRLEDRANQHGITREPRRSLVGNRRAVVAALVAGLLETLP